ncbi:MAG: hypothetical protein L6U99_03695 [Clostridium sp.]|nr:MAG: hypothetical protein L6U99_03695 [Clostridium sp.]
MAIWFGLDVNGRIKKANYKPGDLYGLQFKEWRYDTNGGSVKSRFYNEEHYLYPIYEYKKMRITKKRIFLIFELENDYAYVSSVKRFTSERDVYLPETVKIDNKNYKVVGIKANAFDKAMTKVFFNMA